MNAVLKLALFVGKKPDLVKKAVEEFNAAAVSGRTLVIGIGDSIGCGYNADDPRTANGWIYQLETYLKTKYTGESKIDYANSADWTKSGTWANTSNEGVWYNGFLVLRGLQSNTEGSTMSITRTCDRFDLYYYRYNLTGIFNVSIDGEEAAPVDAGGTPANVCKTYEFAHGEHAIEISVPAGKYAWINGLYSSSPGSVTLHNESRGNTVVANHLPVAGGGLYYLDSIPDDITILFLVALTTNDYGGQTALETYLASYETLLTALKLHGNAVLYTANWQAQRLTIPQASYDAICDGLAGNQIGTINLKNIWGDDAAAEAAGYTTEASRVHPNQAGHTNMAEILQTWL